MERTGHEAGGRAGAGWAFWAAALGVGAGLWGLGCGGCAARTLPRESEAALRRSVMESVRREVQEAEQEPSSREIRREFGPEQLGIQPELRPELEALAGMGSYDRTALSLDEDLLGRPQATVAISLRRAVRTAAERNLELQFARLAPAVSEAQVVAAQAAFDWVLFNNFTWQSLDQPRPTTSPFTPAFEQRRGTDNVTGVRRALTTGGQFSVQQDLSRTDVRTPGLAGTPNPAHQATLSLQIDQPLLRNFGSDVNLSQVRLARNLERDTIAALKRDTIRLVTETEQAYWNLVTAYWDLLILQRLVERGIETRDRLLAREAVDATPAQLADARARVERRRADVLRARGVLRDASDRVKFLMNDPQMSVGTEVLLIPVDDGIDVPVEYSLLDSIMTGLEHRPEVQQAILSIDNTSIRRVVADNARLPRLDLRFQTRFAGLDDNAWGSYTDAWGRDFIDYVVGIAFEQPIGNRGAEALLRQRQLERMQAITAYRNTVANVVLEVKRGLRRVLTNFQLIGQTQASRLAEAENLRSFRVEIELRGFTVERLDIEFRRQETLAQAEREEVRALADYNAALAQLYAAMGTALERNNILFSVPDADDPLATGGLGEGRDGRGARRR